MARGRILSKKISYDQKIKELIDDVGPWGGLFFTWLIAHLDKEGKCYGEPLALKGLVIPLFEECTIEIIENTLSKSNELKLIIWYKIRSNRYIFLPKFAKNQPNLRQNRERESDIPDPPKGVMRSYLKQTSDQSLTKTRSKKRVKPAKSKENQIRSYSGVTPELVRSNSGSNPDQLRRKSGSSPEEVRSNSGVTPAELKIREPNIREPNTTDAHASDCGGDRFLNSWDDIVTTTKKKFPFLAEDKNTMNELRRCYNKYGDIVDISACIRDARDWQVRTNKNIKGYAAFLRNWIQKRAGDDPWSRKKEKAMMKHVELPPNDPNQCLAELMKKAQEQAEDLDA